MITQLENLSFTEYEDGTLNTLAQQEGFRVWVQSWDNQAGCSVSWETDGDQAALRDYLHTLPTDGISNVNIWTPRKVVTFGNPAPGDRDFADNEDVRPLNAFKTYLEDDQDALLVRIVAAEYIMFWQSHPQTGNQASIRMTSDASIQKTDFERFGRLTLTQDRIPKLIGAIVSADAYLLSELEANQANFLLPDDSE